MQNAFQRFTLLTALLLLSGVRVEGAKLGPVDLAPTLRLEVEGNDNVNTSGTNPSEDVILKARINFKGNWQITQHNNVNFDFGFGHERYLENSDLSSQGFLYGISPQSKFEFNVRISDFMSISVVEDLRFLRDPSDLIAVDADGNPIFDVTQYNRFDSRLALIYLWDMNSRTQLTLNLTRSDNIPLDEAFDSTDRTVYSLSSRLTRTFGTKIVGGVTSNYSITRYQEGFQNDGSGRGLGLFLSYQITPLFSLQMTAGYNWNDFESGGGNGDDSDPANWVMGLSVKHSLREDLSYSLGYNRTEEAGFVSNTVLKDQVTLSWAYMWSDKTDLSGSLSYEWATTSGGISPEDFERLTFTKKWTYILGPQTSTFADYRYISKSSNLPGRTFEQNRIRIGIDHNF